MGADDQLRSAIRQFGTVEAHALFEAWAQWVTVFGILAGVIAVMAGGYLMVTSAGNEERVRTGKKTVAWAVAGIVLIIVARGIVAILGNFVS